MQNLEKLCYSRYFRDAKLRFGTFSDRQTPGNALSDVYLRLGLISHTLNFSRSLHHIQITNITSPQLAIAIRNPGLFRRWKRWP